MIWTILQTIGSLLSGISILTAFILYRIEQNDKYNKDIRKAIADTVTTIEEQYSLLKSNFIFLICGGSSFQIVIFDNI